MDTEAKTKGIYKIAQIDTNKIYIGNSTNIEGRWQEHLINLRGNRHHNPEMQKDANIYGISSFIFTILDYLPLATTYQMRMRENYWIYKLIRESLPCYNVQVGAYYIEDGEICSIPYEFRYRRAIVG